MTRTRLLIAAVLAWCLPACSAAPAVERPADVPGSTLTVALDGRPFKLHLPTSYAAGTKLPLVVLLHGYGSDAGEAERYFGLTAEADRRGFLTAMPDGTKNGSGRRFWNATDACCDFGRAGTDDSGYLRRLIDTVKSAYPVDPGRVYLVGHSNGGFMAYRMACEHADTVTAIVSLAGAVAQDAAGCAPSRPVGVLQIHGTADDTIRFDGGLNGNRPYPSAAASVERWRRYNGCSDRAAARAAPLDLDSGLPGAETVVTAYEDCRAGGRVALWSIPDGGHVPSLSPAFTATVVDHLLAQSR
ncbi:alpha/beta hydrolase family esterase [Dactylosporangium sp. NPDC000521]|uniref:extracellular catalytic domain type 1 short-chain-length polyhydroxyalkanoate depolymerase n=1 Tax=Dactylosporangium sp. NPDC000521 TaxID=3363975 RepID=UPI0036AEACDB